jgi:hypothetical protein
VCAQPSQKGDKVGRVRGRIHVPAVYPLRSLDCSRLVLQCSALGAPACGLRCRGQTVLNDGQKGIAHDRDIGAAALLLLSEFDRNILFTHQFVGEEHNRDQAEHVDQQQSVRQSQSI